jgi:hypothetical protein
MTARRSILRATRRAVPLAAMILAFVATFASGGGVSRFVHMMVAHGGEACLAHATSCAAHADARSEVPPGPADPALPDDHCPVCAELAVQLPTPALASPFELSIEVLALLDEREAARQPTMAALRALAARPPPQVL